MTDRRGPQAQAEDRSDLTPDEARAEVEAFMGEGWTVQVYCHWPDDTPSKIRTVRCEQVHADGIELKFSYSTYRAAVDALLQAWRDAVRPWVAEAVHESGTHAARIAKTYDEAPERRAWDTAEAAILTDLHDPDDPDTLRVIARVLKED